MASFNLEKSKVFDIVSFKIHGIHASINPFKAKTSSWGISPALFDLRNL